jgi:hypothetical protein
MRAIRVGFASLLILLIYSSVSRAQAKRAFVSGLGSDGNPHSRRAVQDICLRADLAA